ncbi:MAG: nitrilase-related carbon-nitrogen hydrolase [Vicinamibacterales bacterium]|jgi:nitrilase|nr:nitrilase [Acidobacteriota bacterium]MDP7295754.1 nitrilase-related carbon-nitrogen hydrolase [Vicinamibacterales bacterium]MDP7472123.1 nitrilase-related carbon-nitrogen hydrolase [Vicinamibacterales bacterium]MDP7671010.1 nitrilase-related carbon-nitrogen hydrolase [Vicinamibacterales bacterium]HJO38745.1 nitrilase-related carbon-nitrogen hydrolase [Vicinamibacterales bacterium]
MSRVAIAQTAPIVFDRDRTLELVADWTVRAADEGADLVLFPEAFVSGYPKGLDFGARFGMRTPAGRDDYLRYWNSAVDVPGPAVDRLSAIAKRHRIHLVIGVIERGVGTLYCTVLFLAPDGALMGKHRKLMPTAAERLVWGFGDGSTMPVFDTPLGRLGAVICWENYMPAMRLHMYSKGIQIYCAPTADERDTWVASMRHIAMEGRCFVLSANQYAKRKDFPDDYDTVQGDDPETVVSRGGSCIIDPFGRLLAGPQYEGSCLLTADLDLGDLARGKYDFDVVGHYARPDVFRLEVNERATPVVVTSGVPPAGDPPDDPAD